MIWDDFEAQISKAISDTPLVYEAGKQAEHDDFWFHATNDLAYNPSNIYNFAFAGKCWNDKTFKPKYDIKPNYCANMFLESSINDLVQDLKESEGKLSFERVTSLGQVFQRCDRLTYVPEIYAPKATSLSMTFHDCTALISIDKLTVSDSCVPNNAFYNCTNLVDITIGSKITKNGWCFMQSTKLSKASITSIINALSSDTSGLSVSLSKAAVESAFGDIANPNIEWSSLIATKPNWSVALF